MPDQGAVTGALRERIDGWQSDQDWQVALTASAAYDSDLRAALSAERPPDLFVVESFLFPDLAAQGHLAPVPEGVLDPEGYPSNLVAAFARPGEGGASEQYCLPREVRTLALVYDIDGLAAAGAAPPTSWDELRAAAEELTDADNDRFGFIESPDLSRWLPFLFGAGGTIVDEKGGMALDSAASAAAFDWYVQIFRDDFAGHPGESTSSWAGEVLGKGKGGMAIEGNWVAPYFAGEFSGFGYGVAPLPAGPAQTSRSVAFTSCYAVHARSALQAQAFALAAHLSGDGVVASLPNGGGWMPASSALLAGWRKRFPHLAPFADAVPGAWVWQFSPGFLPFVDRFNRGMAQLLAANIEAGELVDELQQLGQEILDSE